MMACPLNLFFLFLVEVLLRYHGFKTLNLIHKLLFELRLVDRNVDFFVPEVHKPQLIDLDKYRIQNATKTAARAKLFSESLKFVE